MKIRTLTLIIVALAVLVLPWLLTNFRVFQLNLMIVYAIAVLGLNLHMRMSGDKGARTYDLCQDEDGSEDAAKTDELRSWQ